jgi:small-conductance mechanosensitive channel
MNVELLAPLLQLFESMPAWQATVLLLGLSAGFALLMEFVVLRALLGYTKRTTTKFDNILVHELRIPMVLTVSLAGIFLLTRLESVAGSIFLSSEDINTFFGKPSLTIILLAWAFAANRIVNRFVAAVKDEGSRFDFAPVLSNVWTLVVVIGTISLLLSVWEYSIAPLLGAAGIAGIAVGFAARDTVANFFGGIALYFDDTYKIGDYIELDSGEAGTVVNVGIRSTTLMTRDEVLIVVPNSVLNAAMVVNQSAPQRRKRIRVPIGVAYGTDVDDFEAIALEIAADESLVLDSPKPRMRFRAFGDSALQYELLCWVASPTRAAKAQHKLNRELYVRLQETGIEIPYPQRDVRVQRADANGSGAETVPLSVSDRVADDGGGYADGGDGDGDGTS